MNNGGGHKKRRSETIFYYQPKTYILRNKKKQQIKIYMKPKNKSVSVLERVNVQRVMLYGIFLLSKYNKKQTTFNGTKASCTFSPLYSKRNFWIRNCLNKFLLAEAYTTTSSFYTYSADAQELTHLSFTNYVTFISILQNLLVLAYITEHKLSVWALK